MSLGKTQVASWPTRRASQDEKSSCTCLIKETWLMNKPERTDRGNDRLVHYSAKRNGFLTGFLDQLLNWSTQSALAFLFLKLVIVFLFEDLTTNYTDPLIILICAYFLTTQMIPKSLVKCRIQCVFCDTLCDDFTILIITSIRFTPSIILYPNLKYLEMELPWWLCSVFPGRSCWTGRWAWAMWGQQIWVVSSDWQMAG